MLPELGRAQPSFRSQVWSIPNATAAETGLGTGSLNRWLRRFWLEPAPTYNLSGERLYEAPPVSGSIRQKRIVIQPDRAKVPTERRIKCSGQMQRTNHHTLKKATPTQIKQFCEQIAREFKPEKIILFGSHAYGKPEWDSDVDLLIIMPFKGRPHRLAVDIRSSIVTPVAVDLLVRTPEEITKRLEMEDFFIREIIERGKVMYEANHQGVDS